MHPSIFQCLRTLVCLHAMQFFTIFLGKMYGFHIILVNIPILVFSLYSQIAFLPKSPEAHAAKSVFKNR